MDELKFKYRAAKAREPLFEIVFKILPQVKHELEIIIKKFENYIKYKFKENIEEPLPKFHEFWEYWNEQKEIMMNIFEEIKNGEISRTRKQEIQSLINSYHDLIYKQKSAVQDNKDFAYFYELCRIEEDYINVMEALQ